MANTRFAPSPTGFLHIGGVRSALYPYLLAKNTGGKFILRYEDTDRNRLVVEGYQYIKEGLKTFGIIPDEEFKQSERLEIYHVYALKMINNGTAYYCFATTEEIDQMRADAQAEKRPFRFRSPYRDIPKADAEKKIANGEKYTIRLRLPENLEIEFKDELQGIMKFNTNDTDEGVLIKTDGYPTYHLAYIVDDFLMEITHVFRGLEWLPSIPKHVLIYRALNIPMPKMYHLPLILDPEGGKLSKRKGAVAVNDFIKEGYLAEALLNFVALLGWTPKVERNFGEKEREFFSMQDMLELYDPTDMNKSSPVFNREKLIWFNQQYIQQLKLDELQNRFTSWLKDTQYDDPELITRIIEKGPDFLNKILGLEQTRIKTLAEIPAAIDFYYRHKGNVAFNEIKHTKDINSNQIKEIAKAIIIETESKDDNLSDWSHEEWEKFIRNLAEKMVLKAGSVFMALRLMLTDTQFSPPLYEIMEILGKQEVIARLQAYV